MKKLLFVDCDGVLNLDSTKTFFVPEDNRSYTGIDKNLLDLIKSIVKETGCKIVLISTWRKKKSALDYFKKCLAEIGLLEDFIGCTIDSDPCSMSVRFRATEINDFISKTKPDKYAIIDDNDLGINSSNFFLIDEKTGITKEDVDKIIKHLN